MEKKKSILIIYDIVENKRRNKIVKLLKGFRFRVQKSAFEARLSEKQFGKLLYLLKKYENQEDSVRIYVFSDLKNVVVLGKNASEERVEEMIIL